MRGIAQSLPLHLPFGRALAVLILVVHQGDALVGKFIADAIGLGEVFGVEGSEAGGDLSLSNLILTLRHSIFARDAKER